MAEKKRSGDLGQAEVQHRVDQEQKQGYVGAVPDETPNSAYTVQGVTGGAKTPETADDAAKEGAA